MATAAGKNHCALCGKDKASFRCGGCMQDFCYNHVTYHRQQLNNELDEIEATRDLFRQTLTERSSDRQKHALIEVVNRWEEEAIKQVTKTAEEARQLVLRHTEKYFENIEEKLGKLTNELRQNRQENDFVETDLNNWTHQLKRLTEELDKPANVTIRHDSTPLIPKIFIEISSESPSQTLAPAPRVFLVLLPVTALDGHARWLTNGVTVAGGNGQGNKLNQLCYPQGIHIDADRMIFIADRQNHRVVEWTSGAPSCLIVAGKNGTGKRNDQLTSPTNVYVDKEHDCLFICDQGNRRVVVWPYPNGTTGQTIISDVNCYGITMDDEGCLYVSDYTRHEIKRWKINGMTGKVVAGGNGQGNQLNQFDGPTCIFVDKEHSIYVSDHNNHRIMKWSKEAKEGVLVAGGQGQGNGPNQLYYPWAVIVDRFGTLYIADQGNQRVVRWGQSASHGSVIIGGNGVGPDANQLSYPLDLSFDEEDNLYVADCKNHRIQKYPLNPNVN